MVGHIMAIGSGTYRKPHFHGAGAQVIVLGGKGYTLMWPKDNPRKESFIKVDWRKGSLLVPPERWYHSHFTTSAEPGLHLALRRGQRGVGQKYLPTVPEREGGTVMAYEDEPLGSPRHLRSRAGEERRSMPNAAGDVSEV